VRLLVGVAAVAGSGCHAHHLGWRGTGGPGIGELTAQSGGGSELLVSPSSRHERFGRAAVPVAELEVKLLHSCRCSRANAPPRR
jgi:hypothetical protein